MAVRPRKGSAAVCSRCHLAAPGYDQLAERRLEFIPRWGFLVFLLYTMRRVDRRRCGVVAVEEVHWGDGKRTLTKAYMLFLAAAESFGHLTMAHPELRSEHVAELMRSLGDEASQRSIDKRHHETLRHWPCKRGSRAADVRVS